MSAELLTEAQFNNLRAGVFDVEDLYALLRAHESLVQERETLTRDLSFANDSLEASQKNGRVVSQAKRQAQSEVARLREELKVSQDSADSWRRARDSLFTDLATERTAREKAEAEAAGRKDERDIHYRLRQQAESDRDTALGRVKDLERACYSDGHGMHAEDLLKLGAAETALASARAKLERLEQRSELAGTDIGIELSKLLCEIDLLSSHPATAPAQVEVKAPTLENVAILARRVLVSGNEDCLDAMDLCEQLEMILQGHPLVSMCRVDCGGVPCGEQEPCKEHAASGFEPHTPVAAPSPTYAEACKLCDRPPTGWSCTRELDHDGPCAAWPVLVPPGDGPLVSIPFTSEVNLVAAPCAGCARKTEALRMANAHEMSLQLARVTALEQDIDAAVAELDSERARPGASYAMLLVTVQEVVSALRAARAKEGT